MTRRRFPVALGIVCAVLASDTDALELFRVVPLPDDGRGSTAHAVIWNVPDSPGATTSVAGSKVNPAGRTMPMIWVNVNTSSVTANELPLPAGAEGEAIGGARFQNGDLAAIGNIWSGDGPMWGVLWRKPHMGTWGAPQALCEDATQSYASRVAFSPGAGEFPTVVFVTGSAREEGQWLPVLHRVSEDTVVTIDLPVPVRANGAALGFDIDDTLAEQSAAVGWVEDALGRRKPAAWVYDGQQWVLRSIPIPTGAEGQANDLILRGGGAHVVGNVMRSGRSRGIWMDLGFPIRASPEGLLRPLDGYADSATTHVVGTDIDTAPWDPDSLRQGAAFGTSSSPDGSPVATGWVNRQPFAVQQLLVDPTSVTAVRSFKPTDNDTITTGQIIKVVDGTRVGVVVPAPGRSPQAALFIPTETHVPDDATAVIGKLINFNNHGIPDVLWHGDESELVVRTRQSDGVRTATLDLTFTPLSAKGKYGTAEGNYNIIARTVSNQPDAGGTLNIYTYDEIAADWRFLTSFVCSTNSQSLIGELPFDDVREVRLRLEFVGNAQGVAIDAVRLTFD